MLALLIPRSCWSVSGFFVLDVRYLEFGREYWWWPIPGLNDGLLVPAVHFAIVKQQLNVDKMS